MIRQFAKYDGNLSKNKNFHISYHNSLIIFIRHALNFSSSGHPWFHIDFLLQIAIVANTPRRTKKVSKKPMTQCLAKSNRELKYAGSSTESPK